MTEQTDQRAPLVPVERMTAQQIDELAYLVVTAQAWIAVFGTPSWAAFDGLFTLMVGGLAEQGYTEAEVNAWGEHIGGAWQHRSKALSMSINGMPTFLSLNLIHCEDLQLIGDAWEAKEQALAATRPEAGR